MNRFRGLTGFAIVAVLATALAACGGGGGNKTATTTTGGGSPAASGGSATSNLPLASEKILLGAPVSLTGGTADEGHQTQNGYELWKDAVNNSGGIPVAGKRYMVDIKYYDDTSSGDTSAQLAQKLITEDKVNFLLGPYGTTPTLADSRVAEQNEVPMVEGNGAAEAIFNQGYKYTFGVLSPAPLYLQGVVDFALAQSPKPSTVAIVYADDAFSTEVAKDTQTYAQQKGLNVVYFESYKNGETNLTAQVTGAKAAHPDILLNAGHLQEAISITKEAKDLGLQAQLYGFSVGPALPDFVNSLGADANDVVTGSQWTPVVKYSGNDYWKTPQAYADAYRAKFNADPAYQAADGTAAALALQNAIMTANSLDRTKVRDALAKLDIQTFYGPIKFDSRGANLSKPMVVEQIQNGKRSTVWPSEVANAKGLFPTPPWGQR